MSDFYVIIKLLETVIVFFTGFFYLKETNTRIFLEGPMFLREEKGKIDLK